MLKKVCRNLIARLEPMIENRPDVKGEITLEWARNTLRSFDGDQPVCWMGFNVPKEIPLALGYLPFYPELAPTMLAAFDLSADLVEMTEKQFYNMFCCSFHRCSLGAVTQEIWPKPTAILGLSNVCDGQVKLLNLFGDMYGIKSLILEVPATSNERNIDYLEEQLRGIIAPLEDLSGERLTQEKLSETIRISNRLRDTLIQINELRKHSPTPFHGARALNALYTLIIQIWGLPNAPDILENLVREIEEEERSGNVGEEKFRLMLLGGIPTYKTDLFNWLERDMGANIVMSELTDVTWDEMDEQDPYRDLARKIILHPVSGTNEKRVEWAFKIAKDYAIDGAVHISHWGCRQTSGGVGVLREGLETIGIPLMNLDIDLVDPRSYSSGQTYTRIQAFIEMLGQRRGEET